jgi:hypothetical protein
MMPESSLDGHRQQDDRIVIASGLPCTQAPSIARELSQLVVAE